MIVTLKNRYKEMEIKRNWSSPVKEVQVFIPDEYCAACFTAKGTLTCSITNVEHGLPCKSTKFSFSLERGVLTGEAVEYYDQTYTKVKTRMTLASIDVPCGLADVESWMADGCSNTTWKNTDSNGHNYTHTGVCKITEFDYLIDGRPNHS